MTHQLFKYHLGFSKAHEHRYEWQLEAQASFKIQLYGYLHLLLIKHLEIVAPVHVQHFRKNKYIVQPQIYLRRLLAIFQSFTRFFCCLLSWSPGQPQTHTCTRTLICVQGCACGRKLVQSRDYLSDAPALKAALWGTADCGEQTVPCLSHGGLLFLH